MKSPCIELEFCRYNIVSMDQYKAYLLSQGKALSTFKSHASILKKANLHDTIWSMTPAELDALAKVGVVARSYRDMLESVTQKPEPEPIVDTQKPEPYLDLVEWGKSQQDLVRLFDVLWLVESGWKFSEALECPQSHPELCNRLVPTQIPEGLVDHVKAVVDVYR